jgi:hypothetical protein
MAHSFPVVLRALSVVYHKLMRPTHSNGRFFLLARRVGRGLSFSPVVGIGTPPNPHPQASVPSPPLVPGGGAHLLAREGVGESQFRRGDRHWYSIYMCTLWVGG